ncbi:MAG: hypothetical protein ACI8PZ_007026 [Myxococcota bacterium]|jgi:hypothetical protein
MSRVIVALLVVGCAQDISFKAIPNEPPTAIIANHEEGDVVLEGYLATSRAVVDDDDPTEELTARWFVDDEEVCGDPPNELGDAACDWRVPARDTVRLRIEVRDAEGELASDQLDLGVQLTAAPVVGIVAPESSGQFYRNVPVTLTARVTDGEDGPEGLSLAWASSADGVLDADAIPDASDLATSATLLSEGTHTLTATGTDSSGKTGEADVTIDVGPDNTPPSCEILSPEDGTTQTYDAAVPFLALASDVDVEPTVLTIAVTSNVDGLLVEGAPDAEGGIDTTIRMTRGVHTLTLTVVDDAGAECRDSVTVDASNSAPTQPEVEISPEPATALDDLRCEILSLSTDAEGDPLAYGFTWLRDGVDVSEEAVTTDREGDTIPWEVTAPGQVWTCEVRANDGLADGRAGVDEVEVVAPSVRHVTAAATHACQLDNASVVTCWGGDAFGALTLTGGRYLDVSVGLNHSCGITPDQDVVCVGWDDGGRTDTSGLVGRFTHLAAGDAHNCALGVDGEVQCWGNDSEGQASPPRGPFLELAAGFRHSCGVDADNVVTCWGSNVYGRSTPPIGIELVTVSAGDQHSCGIDTAGTVHCWGRNNYGQLPAPGGSYVDVDAGERYSCGVTAGGEVVCWGALTAVGEVNEAPAGSDFIAVDIGRTLSCAVHAAGHVECWGENAEGQLDAPLEWW